MEDKEERVGFPKKAKEHFEGFVKSAKSYPEKSRDKYWWAWVYQFGDEFKEAKKRKLLTPEEVKEITKSVRDFMNTGDNRKQFSMARPFFEESEDIDGLWWEEDKK
jgi:hypothetical protein